MERHEKAKAWMQRIGYDRDALAEATGYTQISIYWFLRGQTPPNRRAKSGRGADRTISDWVWVRFQRACGDVDAEMFGRKKGVSFDW